MMCHPVSYNILKLGLWKLCSYMVFPCVEVPPGKEGGVFWQVMYLLRGVCGLSMLANKRVILKDINVSISITKYMVSEVKIKQSQRT